MASPPEVESRAFRALLEIGAAIGGVLDPAQVGQLVVDRAGSLLEADAAHLWIWRPDQEALRCIARSDACVLDDSPGIPLGESIIGQAFRTHQPVVVDEYQTWEFSMPAIASSGVQSSVGVPLLMNDRPVGCLVVHNYERRPFDGPQVQLLTLFAAQVAGALEAARLYEESQQRRAEAEAAREQIRALNAELERRVYERTAELEAANRELEAFSYSVSHDLRAPLRAVNGYTSILLEEFSSGISEEGLGFLKRIKENGDHMGHLVEVGAKQGESDRTPVYFVKDNGAGFDMQYASKLFGVFQRLHRNQDFEGTGVGLAIVQRIVNRHGGRVWAEGKVNEGATFYFTLSPGGAQWQQSMAA